MSINLNQIIIEVEAADDELDPDHASLYIYSTAHVDHEGIENAGVTLGEMKTARVRTAGVLARLAALATPSVILEARDHDCHPTWRGEPFQVHASYVGCQVATNTEESDWGSCVSVGIYLPHERVPAWLKAIEGWLTQIHDMDSMHGANPDEVIT